MLFRWAWRAWLSHVPGRPVIFNVNNTHNSTRNTRTHHRPHPPHCPRITNEANPAKGCCCRSCVVCMLQDRGLQVCMAQRRRFHVGMVTCRRLSGGHLAKPGIAACRQGAVMRHCAQCRSHLSMPCACMCLADVSSSARRTIAVILEQPNQPPPEDVQQHTNTTTPQSRGLRSNGGSAPPQMGSG
jgi:hypothetical protein